MDISYKKPEGPQQPVAPSESTTVASDVRHQTGRTVNAQNTPRPNASIDRWNAEKGFGFLRMDDGRRVFCHVSTLCSHLNPGRGNSTKQNTRVYADRIVEGQQGLKAMKVECADCATPALWELKPTGPVVFGVQEVKPVCANKPSEPDYKSTIEFDEIWKANEPFRKAQEKERRWKGEINTAFFEEFGEPESVKADGENRIALAYSHGTKTITTHEAYASEHWKISPSDQWKTNEYGLVEAVFSFDDIPGAKVSSGVATTAIDHPELYKGFDKLNQNTQAEVLSTVKKAVLPPETIADKRFETFIESESEQEQVAELRKEALNLQAPGEMYHDSRTHNAQEEITGHYGDETWGTGSYSDVKKTDWYLFTGARKKKNSGYGISFQEFIGGHSFLIPQPEKGKKAEQTRDELLVLKKSRLDDILKGIRKIRPIPTDPRLYDLTPEEWEARFNLRCDDLELDLRMKWEEEDRASMAQTQVEFKEYDAVAEELIQAQKEMSDTRNRAYRFAINLDELSWPSEPTIGAGKIEELKQGIVGIREYSAKAKDCITAGLQARKEAEDRQKAEEEARKAQRKIDAGNTRADTEGTLQPSEEKSHEELQYEQIGEALAKQAEAILSARGAIELLYGELNAGYGRARRQSAVSDRLGEPEGDHVKKFFSYTRARDVDAVLEAAVNYLQNIHPKTEPATPKEAPKPASPVAPMITTPPTPASMNDLMTRFGKRK